MSPNTQYARVAFSKHARERMELRLITEEMVLKTIQDPDRTFLEEDGDTKFIRKVQGVKIHVICKPLPEESKWLVKSTWVRGEDDFGNKVGRYGQYQGRRKRIVPGTVQQRPALLSVNGVLFAILIALVIILIYFIIR